MREKLKLSDAFLYIVIILFGLAIMISGVIGILERDKQQTEQIKILEQSLQEQIQEKEVYMKMVEREGKE